MIIVIGFVGITTTTMVYIRIYLVMTMEASLINEASKICYYISCFPFIISLTYIFGCHGNERPKDRFFSFTFVFLNSSLNPVIYCWKMRHIRHAAINILRNMSWFRNCASIETLRSEGHPYYAMIQCRR